MKRLVLPLLVAVLGSVTVVSAAPAAPATNNAAAMLSQGNSFRDNGRMTEAVWAYRQAAKAGSAEGALNAGKMLCDDALKSRGRQRILDLSEGVADLFQAATNRLPQACAELSGVLRNGIGVNKNLTAAYAWMLLAAKKDNSFAPQLDQLVVQMNPDDVQQAQVLADQYARGRWPTDLVRPVDNGDQRFEIKGITVGGREKMVILNRVTFTEGDTQDVAPEKHSPQSAAVPVTITCKEIGPDYVLVSVAGETHLKLLSSASLID